jgi:hypothetical protein
MESAVTRVEMEQKMQEISDLGGMIRAVKRDPLLSRARAAEVAKHLRTGMSDEAARDTVDLATGGELDAWQLDTLTDWAITIVRQSARAYPEFCRGDNPPCIGKGYCPRDPNCAE